MALQQRSDCKPLAATTDTNLIDEFEDRGYVTAFDVVGNGGLSDEQLKEVGLTKMWAPAILILHRISASLAGFVLPSAALTVLALCVVTAGTTARSSSWP